MPNFLTAEKLARACGVAVNANMRSLVMALDNYGPDVGLDRPHRLAHYGSQWMHESGNFRYDREVWGPTPAQKRYEGRKDLGNTEPGDGEKFKGHTGAQITGRANTAEFMAWCRLQGYNPPDFLANPEIMNADPWEGLGPLWYWSTRKLNPLADSNNPEMITRKINGGLNGYADRLLAYRKLGLVLLGYGPADLERFQAAAQAAGFYDGEIDGEDGPKTRAAIHMMLVKLDGARSSSSSQVKAAPVTEVVEKEVEVAVVPKGATKRSWVWPAGLSALAAQGVNLFADIPFEWKLALGAAGIAAVVAMLFAGEILIRRAKALIKEIQS